MGFHQSVSTYKRIDETFAGLDDFRKIVDDVVLFNSDPTYNTSDKSCIGKRYLSIVKNFSFAKRKQTLQDSH